LTATALPEAQPFERLYNALDALLALIEAAPSALGWAGPLVRYELLLLAELGFGLDLERCAVSGSNAELVAVSPRSGRAVSAAEAEPYEGRLLSLPGFLRNGGAVSWIEVQQGLQLTGHFLDRDILTGRSAALGDARSRLVDRLLRAGGHI
jgi:DNA repair protein RecO (recombination protein O)